MDGERLVEQEQHLLSAMLCDPDLTRAVLPQLAPEDFYIIKHGWLWGAFQALDKRQEPIRSGAVADELKRTGRLEECGGDAFLLGLALLGMTGEIAPACAYTIRQASYFRKANALAEDIATKAHTGIWTANDFQSRIDKMVDRLRQALPVINGDYKPGSQASKIYQEIMIARALDTAPDNFTLPYSAFDDAIPSIRPGKFILIAGPTGSGKTILMEEWAEWEAMLGHRVLYLTTELTEEDHLDRRYVRHTGLRYQDVIAPTHEISDQIADASRDLDAWQKRIDICEFTGGGYKTALAQMTQAVHQGVTAIFVDYFWEILEDDRKTTIEQAVKGFHQFAKKYRVLLVVGSQLTETEYGPRTYGTRRLDQKAAVSLMIEKAEEQKTTESYQAGGCLVEAEEGKASPFRSVKILKNTFGPVGDSVKLFMHGARFRFIPADQIGIGGGSFAGYISAREQRESDRAAAVFRGGDE